MKYNNKAVRKKMITAFAFLMDNLTDRDLHGIEAQVSELLDLYNILEDNREKELQNKLRVLDENFPSWRNPTDTLSYGARGTIIQILEILGQENIDQGNKE